MRWIGCRELTLTLVLLFVFILNACSDQIPPAPPRFEQAACQFEIPLGEIVECGNLIVPEDHHQPNQRTIKLHVAIFKSHSQNPAPDPVVYLEGGPGFHVLDTMVWNIKPFEPILNHRDLIVFDQRGVGHAKPSLDCPELRDLNDQILAQNIKREERVNLEIAANIACRDRLAGQGINLAAYTTSQSAADVNALRLALGYDEWNLYGISYGSRLALIVMRDFPEGIRSVILDSVYPPQVDPEAEAVLNADRAFDLLFSQCAEDEACRAAFPDLETVFEELIHQLDAEPIILKVRHPLEHAFYDVSLNGSDLTAATFALLYDANQIPWLPRTIFEIHQGVYNGRLPKYILWSVFVNEVFSEGVIYSNLCSEELPFSSPASFSIATAAVRPALRAYFEDYARIRTATCDAWGVPPADPIENKAVMSDIPTLILAGEYDPTTPPDWSRMTAEGLNNAYYFEFPGVGHGVLWVRECAQVLSRDFLELPTQAPDSTCLANQKTSVSFVTGTSR